MKWGMKRWKWSRVRRQSSGECASRHEWLQCQGYRRNYQRILGYHGSFDRSVVLPRSDKRRAYILVI